MRCGLTGLLVLPALAPLAAEPPARYRSPFDVAASPDGKAAYVSDRTAGVLYAVDLAERRVRKEVALRGQPTGIAVAPRGERVYVAEYDAGSVAEVDAARLDVVRRLPAGLRPMGLALASARGILLACNTVTDDVSVVDLGSGAERTRIATPREPFFCAVAPDERLAIVGNFLPATPASDPASSAALSIIDLDRMERAADIRLPPGSTSVRQCAVSPDGRWSYILHTVGRFGLPPTQVERGWIYTNALSVIDLANRRLRDTVLLDNFVEGAANPWGIAIARDGQRAWVTLSGVHQLATLDLGKLDTFLDGPPDSRRPLIEDLTALLGAGIIQRRELPGRLPRGIALLPDERALLVAAYHSAELLFVPVENGAPSARIGLGPTRAPDAARRGEMIFHDGTVSFQGWLSCSSCHPDEGRTDGLRWDLLNDGLGSPQRTRSLLWAHLARPTTARGVRAGIEVSVAAGFHFVGTRPTQELVEPVIAYLSSLEPEPSPYLGSGGKLVPAAERGKAIFEGKGGCTDCHRGPARSDHKLHDNGAAGDLDPEGEKYVTKRLVELYRTAPFLHDGRAATLRDVFERFNTRRRHGKAHLLTKEELDDLVAFLLSL